MAAEKQQRTQRAVSRLETARKLDSQRLIAKDGGKMGLTTYMKQL